MTKYHGGKQRIGDEIAEIIKRVSEQVEDDVGIRFKGYVEPFCGMLGVYRHIPELFKDHKIFKYRAGDINGSVIKMWKASQEGWKPPTKCSEKQFYELKGNGKSSAEKGFIGHACAFRGVYFGTYYAETTTRQINNNKKRVLHISDILSSNKVELKNVGYSYWNKLKGYIIYCDPPYFSNSLYPDEYNKYQNFDSDAFYGWAEKMAQNNLVFISERAKLPYKVVGKFMSNEKLYLIS